MKSILITGAYGGMGKEAAKLLRNLGYKVFALDIKTEEMMLKKHKDAIMGVSVLEALMGGVMVLGSMAGIFTIPSFIAGLLDSENAFAVFVTKYVNYTTPVGFAAYIIIIILFCFFYTFLQINPEELSKNLSRAAR